MAGGQVRYTIGFDADTTAAKQAVQDLVASLQKVQSANLSNFRINTELNAAAESARTLEMHIRAATNVNTGKLNLNDLVTSINKADTSLSKLLQDIQLGGTTGAQAFKSFSNAIIQTEVPLRNTNKLIHNIGTTLKNTLKWQLSSNLIHGLESTLKGAVSYVKELNTSLTDIRIVTGKSLEDMTAFAEQANKAAKQLSTTTKEYTKASLLYYQQGDSDRAAAEKAAITVKAANVAFTASAQEMSQMLTAVWNSYRTGEDQLEHVVDVMAKLGATTATSMEEISTGMQKVAATANTVGVSMEQMSAMIATTSSVTRQSAEAVGTSWNTILARITSLKLGQTLEDGVDLTKYTKALESIGVKALDISGNLREAGTLIDEIGAKWQTMNEAQKTAFAQTVGGVRQYTQIMAFFENFDKYQANMETALSADGTLQQQADIYAQSWEAASARSRAALEGLYDSLLNDQSFIKMTNMFTGLIEGIEKMVDTLGGASGVMTTIGTVAMAVFANKLPSMLRNLGDMFTNYLTSPIKAYEKSLQEVQRGISDSRSMQDSESLKQTSELVALKQQLIASEGLLSDKQKAAYNTQINALGEEIAHVHDLEQAYNNTEKSIDRIIAAVGRQKDAYASMSAEARSAISQTITDSSNFQNLNTTYNSPLQAAFANYGSALKIGGVSGTLSAEMQSIIDSGTDASTVIGRITSAISTMQAAVKGTNLESMFANLDSATMAPGKLLREFTLQLNTVQQQADTIVPQMTEQIGEALNSMPNGVAKTQLINQFAAMGEAAGLSADQLVEFASTAKWSQENIEQLKAALDQGATGFNRFAQMAGKAVSMIGSAAATYRTVGNAVTQLNEGTFNLGTALMLITSIAPGVVTAISMIGTAGQAALGWIGLIGILVAGIVAAIDGSTKAAQKAREEAAKAYNEKEQTKVDEHKEELKNTQSLIQNYSQLYETYLKTGEGQEDLAASAQLLADAYNVVGGSVLIAQGRFEEFNELLRNQINFDDQIADLERIANATRTAFNVDRGYEHTTKSSDFMQSAMNPQSYYYQAGDAQHNVQVGNKYLNEVMRTGGAYMSTNVEGRMGSAVDYSIWNESNRKLLANINPLMELFRNDAMYNADGSINWDYVNEAIANFAEQNEEVEAVIYEAMFKAMGVNWQGGEPTTTSNLGARLKTMRESTNIDNQIIYGQNLKDRTKDPGFWSLESSKFETWFGDLRLQIGQIQMEALESIYNEVIEGYTSHEYGKGLSYSDLVGSNGEIIWNNAEDRYEQYGGLRDLLQQAYSTRETLQAELETADEQTALGIQKMIDDNNAVITELEAIVGDDTDITKAYNTSAEALEMVAELQMTAKQIRSFLGQNEENTSFKEYQTKRQQFVEMVKSQAGNELYESEFQDYLTLWDESLYGENEQYESRNGYVYDLENQRYLIDEAQQHAFDSAAQSYVDTWLSTYTSFDDYTHAYGDLYGTLGQNSAAMDAATKLIDQGRITIDDITYELLAILGNNINRLAEYTEMDETTFAESDIGRQIALTRAQKVEQDLSANRGTAQAAASKMKSGMTLEDAENIRTTFWDAEGNLIEELQDQMEGDISSWEDFTKMSFSERQTYLSKLSKAYDASLLQSEQDIVDAAQKSRIKAETDFEDLKDSFTFENAFSSFAHPEAIVDITAEQIKSTRAILNTYQFDAEKGFYREGQSVDEATFDVEELADLNLTYEQFIQLEEALQRIENANTAEEAAQARIDALKLIEEATEGATAKINLLKNALDQLPQSATDIEALVKELNQMNMVMPDGSSITAAGLYGMNSKNYQTFMRGALDQKIKSTISQSEYDALSEADKADNTREIVTDAEAVYYQMLQDQLKISDEQKKLNASTAQWQQHLSEIQDNADDLKDTFSSLMDKVQNGGALTSLEKMRMTADQIAAWENATSSIQRAKVAAEIYASSLDQVIQKQTEQKQALLDAKNQTKDALGENMFSFLGDIDSFDLSSSTKMIEAFGGDSLSDSLKDALVNAYNAAIDIVGTDASNSVIVKEMQHQLDLMIESVDEESQAVIDQLQADLATMYSSIYEAEIDAANNAVDAWTNAFNTIKNARAALLGGGTLSEILAGDIDSTYTLVRTVMAYMKNLGQEITADEALEMLRTGGDELIQKLELSSTSVRAQMQAKGLEIMTGPVPQWEGADRDSANPPTMGMDFAKAQWGQITGAGMPETWNDETEAKFAEAFKSELKILFPDIAAEGEEAINQLFDDLNNGQKWDEVSEAMTAYETSVRGATTALEEQTAVSEAKAKRDKDVADAQRDIDKEKSKIQMLTTVRNREAGISVQDALTNAGYSDTQFLEAFGLESLSGIDDQLDTLLEQTFTALGAAEQEKIDAYSAYSTRLTTGDLKGVIGASDLRTDALKDLNAARYEKGVTERQTRLTNTQADQEDELTTLERELDTVKTEAAALSTELSNLQSIDISSMPKAGTAAYNALAKALKAAGKSMADYNKMTSTEKTQFLYGAQRSNIIQQKANLQRQADLALKMAQKESGNDQLSFENFEVTEDTSSTMYSYYRDWLSLQTEIAAQEEALAATYGEERAAIVGIQDAEWSRQKAAYETAKTERATQQSYLDTLNASIESGTMTFAERMSLPPDLIAEWDALGSAEERAALLMEKYAGNMQSLATEHDELIGTLQGAQNALMGERATFELLTSSRSGMYDLSSASGFDTFILNTLPEQYQAAAREAYSALEAEGTNFAAMSNEAILLAVVDQLSQTEGEYESTYASIKGTILDQMTSVYSALAEKEQAAAEAAVAKWEQAFSTIASLRQNLLSGKSIGSILTEDLDTFMVALNAYRQTAGESVTGADLASAYKSGQLEAKDFQYGSVADYQRAMESSYMVDHMYNRDATGAITGFKSVEDLARAFGIGTYENGENKGLAAAGTDERAEQIAQLKSVAAPYMKEMLMTFGGMDEIDALRTIEEYFGGENAAANSLLKAGQDLQAAAAVLAGLKMDEQAYEEAKTEYETIKAEQQEIIEKNQNWQDISQSLRHGEESVRTDLEGNEDKASEYIDAVNAAFTALGIDKKVDAVTGADNDEVLGLDELTELDYQSLENYFGEQANQAGQTIVASASTFAAIVTGAAGEIVDDEGHVGLGYGEGTEQEQAAEDAVTEAGNIATGTGLKVDQYDRDLSYYAEQVGQNRDSIEDYVEAIMEAEGTFQEWNDMTKENQLLLAEAAVEYNKATEAIETLSNAASLFSAIESEATDAESLEKKAQAYEKLAQAVNNYFKDAEVGSEFVQENLDDIKEWANGSIEAMERLEKKILSQQLNKMFNKTGQAVQYTERELSKLNQIADGLKFGEQLEKSDIKALQRLQQQLGLTNNQMRDLMDTMGITSDWGEQAAMSVNDFVSQFSDLESANAALEGTGMRIAEAADGTKYLVATTEEAAQAMQEAFGEEAMQIGDEIPQDLTIPVTAEADTADAQADLTAAAEGDYQAHIAVGVDEVEMDELEGPNDSTLTGEASTRVQVGEGESVDVHGSVDINAKGDTKMTFPKVNGSGNRPGGGGGGCFIAGTLIATINGYKNIENIVQNDIVLSYNEKSQMNEYSKVVQVMTHYVVTPIYTLYINNDKLQVTGIHKFYINRNNNFEWICAYNLIIGDNVLFADGTWHKIDNITKEFDKVNVYNFEVSNNHNYYVGQNRILAHNKGGGGGCFAAGTLIKTINNYKPIEQIKAGDWVLSYNEYTRHNEYSQVIQTMIHIVYDHVYVLYAGNDKLVVTGIHRFYINRNNIIKWIAASDLQVGDRVLFADGIWHHIEKIETQLKFIPVYNFEVSNNHNYYVGKNSILAHNKGGGRRETRRRDESHKRDPEKTRYHNTDRALAVQQDKLTKLNKLKSFRYGDDYLKTLQNENKAITQQMALNRKKYLEAKKYSEDDKRRLQDIAKGKEKIEYTDKDGNLQEKTFKLNVTPVFDDAGNLDFDKYQDDMFAEYNKMVDWYNSLSGEEQEKQSSYFDAWKERWNELMDDAVSKYEEAQDRMREAQEANLESLLTMSANVLEGLTYTIELKLDATEFTRQYEDLVQKKLNKFNLMGSKPGQTTSDALGQSLMTQMQSYMDEMTAYEDMAEDAAKRHDKYTKKVAEYGSEQALADAVAKAAADKEAYEKALRKKAKYGESALSAEEKQALEDGYDKDLLEQSQEWLTDSDYEEILKKVRDGTLSASSALEDLKDQYDQLYGNIWAKYEEDYQKFKSLMDHKTALADSFLNMLELLGEGENYAAIQSLNEQKAGVVRGNNGQFIADQSFHDIDLAKQHLKTYQEELERFQATYGSDMTVMTDEQKSQYLALLQRVNDAQDELLNTTQTTLESLRAMYEAEVSKIADQFESQVVQMFADAAGEAGAAIGSFEDLADEYAWYTEEQDRYLNTSKQLYEVSKLNRQINDSLNDSVTKTSRERLKNLQEEINLKAKSNDLTEYDIKQMQLQYELALALDDLENAKADKSTVRLVRDQNGNMGYQYTADEDKVSEAQQKYEDVLQDINDLATERVREVEQNMVDTMSEYYSKMQEISMMYADNEELRNEKLSQLNQKYQDKLYYLNQQYGIATEHLMINQGVIFSHYGDTVTSTTQGISAAMQGLFGQIGSENEPGSLIGAMNTFKQGLKDAMAEYKEMLDAVRGRAGIGGGADGLAGMQEQMRRAQDQAREMETAIGTLDTALQSELRALQAQREAWDDFSRKLRQAQDDAERTARAMRELQDALRSGSGGTSGDDDYGASGSGDESGEGDNGDDGGGNDGSTGSDTVGLITKKKGYYYKQSGLSEKERKKKANRNGKYKKAATLQVMEVDGGWAKIGESKWVPIKDHFKKPKQEPEGLSAKGKEIWAALSYVAFASGGLNTFTGPAWLDGTKQKPEYVLNAEDTEKMFDAVDAVAGLDIGYIEDLLATVQALAGSLVMGMGSLISTNYGTTANNNSNIQQDITINADFPNVTDQNEIVQAFEDLANLASQYVGRAE